VEVGSTILEVGSQKSQTILAEYGGGCLQLFVIFPFIKRSKLSVTHLSRMVVCGSGKYDAGSWKSKITNNISRIWRWLSF